MCLEQSPVAPCELFRRRQAAPPPRQSQLPGGGFTFYSGSSTDIDFSDATLTRANFKEATIKTLGTSHDGRNSAHIKFDNTDLTDANFDGAYVDAKYGSVYDSDGTRPWEDAP